MVAKFWQLASDAASSQFETTRRETQIEIAATLSKANDAEARASAAQSSLEVAKCDAEARLARIAELETHLIEQQTANALLREQLADARGEIRSSATALADARRDFSAELEKLSETLRQTEQRLIGAEKRALLEIETERAAAQRARKEAHSYAKRLEESERVNRTERDELRDNLAGLKTELAVAAQRRTLLEEQVASREAELSEQAILVQSLRHEIETFALPTVVTNAVGVRAKRLPRSSPSDARKGRRDIKFPVGPLGKPRT